MAEKRTCKHCGCHKLDACWHPEFGTCWWVNEDECSHCLEVPGEAVKFSEMNPEVTPDKIPEEYERIMKERKKSIKQ